MMKRIGLILSAILCCIACRRDHLYYATSDQVVVRLNIDWSVSQFTPNGVTVYLFNSQGYRYGDPILSSNYKTVNLKLPADTYTIVVHNNSRSEFANVEFVGTDRLSTFEVRSLEWHHPYYEPETEEFVAYEPEDILSATVRGVVVSGDRVRYHYDKPDLSTYTSSEVIEVDITPAYIVHLGEIRAFIRNAENTVKIPVALVGGMSRGYHFGLECTLEDRMLGEFYIDVEKSTRSTLTRAYEDYFVYERDSIYLNFKTFGLPFDLPDEGVNDDQDGDGRLDDLDKMHVVDLDFHDVYTDLMFFMADDLIYKLSTDVTEHTWVEDLVVRKKYLIVLEDDLSNYKPEEGGGDDDDNKESEDGTMDPTVDDWVDIVVPLPM